MALAGITLEWSLYDLVGEQAGEIGALAAVGLFVVGAGWTCSRMSHLDGRVSAGVLAATVAACLLGANFYFLRWLWIEPRGRLSVGEFGWNVPFYLNIAVGGGAFLAFFLAAALWRRA